MGPLIFGAAVLVDVNPSDQSTNPQPVDSAAIPKACSAYKLCKHLAGDRCPIPAGTSLDCCKGGLAAPFPAPKQESTPAPAKNAEHLAPAPAKEGGHPAPAPAKQAVQPGPS